MNDLAEFSYSYIADWSPVEILFLKSQRMAELKCSFSIEENKRLKDDKMHVF